MAHFKRGYRRTVNKTGPRWLKTPSAWNITFHTRPTRRKAKREAAKILKGLDSDAAIWPVGKKPHRYYW